MAMVSCPECGGSISSEAKVCPKCGKSLKTGCFMTGFLGLFFAVIIIVFIGMIAQDIGGSGSVSSSSYNNAKTGSASNSRFNNNIIKSYTSEGLSLSDLAWHAKNTYGWDCDRVVSKGYQYSGYYEINCSSGVKLRVYPREGKHPKITNINGTY